MKNLLTSKAGVTVLEGIIALGLLALVAGGAFGVLLASSRQSSQPDIREEMAFAMERAHNGLKRYVGVGNNVSAWNNAHEDSTLSQGLCDGDNAPLREGRHTINCMLPPICDSNSSFFTYTVGGFQVAVDSNNSVHENRMGIQFNITCNGYSL